MTTMRFGEWLRDASLQALLLGLPVPAEDRCRRAYDAGQTPREFVRLMGCAS